MIRSVSWAHASGPASSCARRRSKCRRSRPTFFGALSPGESPVFFYTKEGQPSSDAIIRLVVGVGRLMKVGSILDWQDHLLNAANHQED
jgi:hypothetical protein